MDYDYELTDICLFDLRAEDKCKREMRIVVEYVPKRRKRWTTPKIADIFLMDTDSSGIGLLLEATRRREAGFINCGLWLAISIYAITQSWPIPSKAVVIVILVISFCWYVIPPRRDLVTRGDKAR